MEKYDHDHDYGHDSYNPYSCGPPTCSKCGYDSGAMPTWFWVSLVALLIVPGVLLYLSP